MDTPDRLRRVLPTLPRITIHGLWSRAIGFHLLNAPPPGASPPRSDPSRPLTGVFATRSPDRPNPIGLHRVTVHKVAKNRLRVGPMEAIDGTPVIDIKPVLCEVQES